MAWHTSGMPKPAHEIDFNTACAKRLDACREALGITSKGEFAEALGVGQSRYSNWLAGRHIVPPDVVARARERFGITADWVYCGDASGLPNRIAGKALKAAS